MAGLNMINKPINYSQINLFSTPVVINNNVHEITDEELSYLKSLPLRESELNSLSKSSFILDNNNQLRNIAHTIDFLVQRYVDSVLEITNNVVRTQSWITVNKKGQRHHAHEHPNTFISAVYYPVCNSGNFVVKKVYSTIQEKFFFNYGIKNYNPANSKNWTFEVKTGDLVIFPGWLSHYCTENQHDEDRIALGVNYFLKGKFGSEDTVDLINI